MPIPRTQRRLLAAVAAFFLLSLGALVALTLREQARRDDPARPDDTVLGLSIPPFSAVDQSGKPLSREDLNGRVTVMNFIFTHCVLVCPAMTDTLSKVVERLEGTSAQFISLSVDPEHDTPERLKLFAAQYRADHSRWRFATAEAGVVETMLRDGLKFALRIDPDPANTITLPEASGGGTMANIQHPGWFVLIGSDGKVLGVYSSSSPEDVDRLVKRVRKLASK